MTSEDVGMLICVGSFFFGFLSIVAVWVIIK